MSDFEGALKMVLQKIKEFDDRDGNPYNFVESRPGIAFRLQDDGQFYVSFEQHDSVIFGFAVDDLTVGVLLVEFAQELREWYAEEVTDQILNGLLN